MSLTVNVVERHDVGKGEIVIADVTFDSSYPTGGEALTPGTLKMRCGTVVHVQAQEAGGRQFAYDRSAQKLKALGKTLVLTKAGLQIGTGSKAKVRVNTATVQYLIDGKSYSLSAGEVAFTAVTHDIADGSEAVFLVTANAAGTLALTKGASAVGAGNAVIPWSSQPNGQAVLGHVRIVTVGAAFVAGTDLLDDAEITDTYTDVAYGEADGPALAEVPNTTNLALVTTRIMAFGR